MIFVCVHDTLFLQEVRKVHKVHPLCLLGRTLMRALKKGSIPGYLPNNAVRYLGTRAEAMSPLVVREKQMSPYLLFTVALAKAGAQNLARSVGCPWVPAFAGMTKGKSGYQALNSRRQAERYPTAMISDLVGGSAWRPGW
jgi:hypothetical protein